MNFKISQNKLAELINISGKAISPNSPLPSLSGIKFQINKDYIECVGSDSDITIRVRENKSDDFVYEVEDEGSIIINKSYISDIIKHIDSDVVNMEIIDGNLTRISGNKAQFDINGFRSNDYPVIDFKELDNKFEIKASEFKEFIYQTFFAASVIDAKPILKGINLFSNKEKLVVVATDSYRLAKKEKDLSLPFEFNITILAKSLLDIARSFEDNEIITIGLNDKKAQFYNDRILIQTRLIEGNFPDTSRLIPTSFERELVIDKKELLSAISRCSFIKSESDQFAILRLSMNKNEVVMYSRSQEIGNSKENMIFDSFTGEDLELFISSKFVSDAVNAVRGEKVKIGFTKEMQPFVIKDVDDNSMVQLVVPVRGMV